MCQGTETPPDPSCSTSKSIPCNVPLRSRARTSACENFALSGWLTSLQLQRHWWILCSKTQKGPDNCVAAVAARNQRWDCRYGFLKPQSKVMCYIKWTPIMVMQYPVVTSYWVSNHLLNFSHCSYYASFQGGGSAAWYRFPVVTSRRHLCSCFRKAKGNVASFASPTIWLRQKPRHPLCWHSDNGATTARTWLIYPPDRLGDWGAKLNLKKYQSKLHKRIQKASTWSLSQLYEKIWCWAWTLRMSSSISASAWYENKVLQPSLQTHFWHHFFLFI